MNKQKLINILKVIAYLILLATAIYYLTPLLSSEKIRSLIFSLGILGPLVVILYVVFSHVLAPVIGIPIILLSATIFGMVQTMVYVYLGAILSSIACFYISKCYGRNLVKKLVGEKVIKQIDDFEKVFGTKVLVLSRVFGLSLFEVVSYAAGLTKMKFEKYFLITTIGNFFPMAIYTYVFRNFDFTLASNVGIWSGAMLGITAIFAYFLNLYITGGK